MASSRQNQLEIAAAERDLLVAKLNGVLGERRGCRVGTVPERRRNGSPGRSHTGSAPETSTVNTFQAQSTIAPEGTDMLTIRAISNGQGYDSRHLVNNDYYAEGERVTGVGLAAAPRMLGLSGEVAHEQFESIRQGLDPATGEFLQGAAQCGSRRRRWDDPG